MRSTQTQHRFARALAGRMCTDVVRSIREHVFVSGPSDEPLIRRYRCRVQKTPNEFAWKRQAKGQRDSFCRPCRSAYGKEHYAANRQRYIDQAQRVKQRKRLERTKLLFEYFASHPCCDCGESDPVVLEFDHLRDKKFAVAPAIERRSWQSILDEIEKCEVVCANCHRRRTSRRRGAIRFLLAETNGSV